VSAAARPVVPIRGRGAVRLPAFGLADAEHRVEKELRALLPGARVTVTSILRVEPEPRIVEEFSAEYLLELAVPVPADAEDPRAEAFRTARTPLHGTRYAATEWLSADPSS
jgi:hypothetical protein